MKDPMDDDIVADPFADRLSQIEVELAECKRVLMLVHETLVKADETITAVAKEVKPTIDSLMEVPMLKMFLGKRK